jgi:hypothetical protein
MSRKTKTYLWLDICIFTGFLIMGITGLLLESEVTTSFSRATIIDFHAVVGLITLLVSAVHIGLHWKWWLTVSKRATHLKGTVRTNLIINTLLLICFVLVNLTGIDMWQHHYHDPLHSATGFLILILSGVHLVRHWKWIKTHTRRYLSFVTSA